MDAAIAEIRQLVEIQQSHGAHSPTQLEWWYFTGHLWKVEGVNPARAMTLTFF